MTNNHYMKYVETTVLIKALYSNLEELYTIAIGEFAENNFREMVNLLNRLTHYGVDLDMSQDDKQLTR